MLWDIPFWAALVVSVAIGFLYFRDLGDISQMILKVKRENMIRFIRYEYRFVGSGLAAFALAALVHFAFDVGPGVVFFAKHDTCRHPLWFPLGLGASGPQEPEKQRPVLLHRGGQRVGGAPQ